MKCLQFVYNQFIKNKKNYNISVLNGLLHPLRGAFFGGLRLL